MGSVPTARSLDGSRAWRRSLRSGTSGVATCRSAASASPRPAPIAAPCTAATIGNARPEQPERPAGYSGFTSPVRQVVGSARSAAPAQKCLPAEASTIARQPSVRVRVRRTRSARSRTSIDVEVVVGRRREDLDPSPHGRRRARTWTSPARTRALIRRSLLAGAALVTSSG